jgi:hypothetical protein
MLAAIVGMLSSGMTADAHLHTKPQVMGLEGSFIGKMKDKRRGKYGANTGHKSSKYRANFAPNDPTRTQRHRDGSPAFQKPMGPCVRLSDLLPYVGDNDHAPAHVDRGGN